MSVPAYYIQTDTQHLPPIMRLIPHLGGTVFTRKEEIYQFARDKYPDLDIRLCRNRDAIRSLMKELKIRVIIYPCYATLGLGKSVQIFHGGLSDKLYVENPRIMLYDLVLFPGEKTMLKVKNAGYLDRIPQWKIVGYPKFDPLIRNEIRVPKLFEDKRPVILYAPTWVTGGVSTRWSFSDHGESSLPNFGKAIVRELSRDYNLVIKYHSRAYRSTGDIFEQIDGLIRELGAEKRVKCVWDDNILPYMKMADLMISDISTACYEWFHFDKPILFANPSPEHYRRSEDMFSNTYAWNAGDVIDREEDILPLARKNLERDEYKARRNDIFRLTVYKPDGHAAERSAEAIRELIRQADRVPYSFLLWSTRWIGKYRLARADVLSFIDKKFPGRS